MTSEPPNRTQQRIPPHYSGDLYRLLWVRKDTSGPPFLYLGSLPTPDYTMTAVQQLPTQILTQYNAHQSLNLMSALTTSGPSGHPTPPMTTRKRKRAHQYTVSYSEVQEVDSNGRLREVIVIEDTPPPPPTISPSTTHNGAYSASYQPPVYSAPIRTRARAAAEAQALSASSSSVLTAPAPKKRKRDHNEEVRAPTAKKLAVGSSHTIVGANSTQSRSGAVTEDVSIFLLLGQRCSLVDSAPFAAKSHPL